MPVVTPAGVPVRSGSTRLAWLKARKAGLGASDTAAVLGLSPYSTPLDVWLEKRASTVDESAGEAAEWGNVLEAAIARRVNTLYRDQIGHVRPSPGLLRHDLHEWMLATPDRLLYRPEDDPGWASRLISEPDPATALLEVKTAGHRQAHRWTDGPPAHYLIQAQQQLAVTGLRHGYIAVLHAGQHMPPPYRVDRDEAVIEQIVKYAGDWWQRHIVEGVQPEPRWPADEDNLALVFDVDPGAVRVADDDTWAALDRLRKAKDVLAIAKATERRAAFELKEALGEATELEDVEGVPLATWRQHERRTVDTARLRLDHPDLVRRYERTSTYRQLRLKGVNDDA